MAAGVVSVTVADHLASLIEEAAADSGSPLYGVPTYWGGPTGDTFPKKHIVVAESPRGIGEDREFAGLGRRQSGRTSHNASFEVNLACVVLGVQTGQDLRPGLDAAIELATAIEDLVVVDRLEGTGLSVLEHWQVERTESVPWATDELLGWRQRMRVTGKARFT